MPENLPISREKAIALLKNYEQKESDWSHYLETEAIMKALARKFGEKEVYWGMIGLLHDVDWALTRDNWKEHCLKAGEILKANGFNSEFIQIIQSHGYGCKEIPALESKMRTRKIEYCLAAAETLAGLIYAYALMRGKKVSDMDVSGLKKKFNNKSFAQNCNRELIKEIEKAGLSLDDFFSLSIDAIKGIKKDRGLE